MSSFETDGVYKWFSGQSHENNIYEIHKINYTSQIELIFFLVYIILLFIILTIFISGCIHALFNPFCKCCRREDNFRYSYIFIFSIYSWEYICDILFITFIFINHYNTGLTITDTNNEYTILLIIALGCLSFTYLINLILCCRMIYVLYKHNKRIYDWFHSYCHSFSFIFISLITFGPFISVPFFNTNLYGFSLFSMQISKYDINYILGKKFFNILTQLLPLFLIRIIYLFWIKTWDVIILSSFLPMMFSFFITSWYSCRGPPSTCFQDRYLSKHQLHCFFEVSGPNLSSLRHLGLTKHLQNKFCQLFKIDQNEIEVSKPIDCFDNVAPRFAMRFIVRSDEDTLERIEHDFCSYVQNEQLARAVSEIYGVGLLYISKQLTEIVEIPHLLWGSKSKQPVHVYNDIENNNASYFGIDGNKTVSVYHNGEIRNININPSTSKKKSTKNSNGYSPMNSRSSSSYNHPPINDGYNHEMPEIMEEDMEMSDDERERLFNKHNSHHKIADASSLYQTNQLEVDKTVEMVKFNTINEDNADIEEKQHEIPRLNTPGSNEDIVNENSDLFDANHRRLSSQEIRLKKWEAYCAQTKQRHQHKSVMTPSFSISTMNNDHQPSGSLGLIIGSDPKATNFDNATLRQNSESQNTAFACNSNAGSVSNFNHNTMVSMSGISADEEIPQLKFAPTYATQELEEEEEEEEPEPESMDNNDTNETQLKLDTTAPITHQTKSVMVDPHDIQVALSLQSDATNMVSVKEEFVNGLHSNNNNQYYNDKSPQHLCRLSQKYEHEAKEQDIPLPPPVPPTDPLQPPTSLNSAYGDFVHERDHSESLQDDEIAIEVDYDQILTKPRTHRRSSRPSHRISLQTHERIMSNEQDGDEDTDEEDQVGGLNDTDSFDTHTGSEDSEQTDTESTTKTSSDSSDTVIVHEQNVGPHYQYNKVIEINIKRPN